jgi:membrane fusion protein, multidrug efflux system
MSVGNPLQLNYVAAFHGGSGRLLARLCTVVVAAAVLASACGGAAAPETEREENPRRVVAVAAVEVVPRDLSLSLNLSGNIEPIREVRISSRMSGILEEVSVEEGSRVRSGSILARLDVAEQQAELDRAKTRLDLAEAYYRRARDLHAAQLISDEEYDNTRAERAIAESEVRLWETRIQLGTVLAHSAGVITHKFVEAGDAVTSGQPLFVVADDSTLVVRVGITDVYASRLSVGQQAKVTVDAMPDRPFDARIRRVFPSADPDTRLHPVEFELSRLSGGARPVPGYLARVEVDVERLEEVMAVPNEALLGSTAEGPFVFVIEDDRLVPRAVVPGVSRRDWTQILEGLELGELVVGSNPANLREGMPVHIADRIAPTDTR